MDLFSRDGFLSRVKWIFSSLSRIMLWASRLPSPPLQGPKEHLMCQFCLQTGLKTLVSARGEQPQNPCRPPFIINPYIIPSPSPPMNSPSLLRTSSNSSSCSSAMDDLIGAESGVYMNAEDEETLRMDTTKEAPYNNRNLGKQKKSCERTREFPPPISILARTGNLPGHMPWILTRHYNNGNLVLKEEKVKHYEYFEAYRDNGRLILNLVLLDDTITCCHEIPGKHNGELKLEELESVKEEQEKDRYSWEDKLGEYEYQLEGEADPDQDDCVDSAEDTTLMDKSHETIHKRSTMILMPKTYLENEVERTGALPKCLTYTGREISDENFLCNISAHHVPGGGGTHFGQSGSAPLVFSFPPMGTVM